LGEGPGVRAFPPPRHYSPRSSRFTAAGAAGSGSPINDVTVEGAVAERMQGQLFRIVELYRSRVRP